jgi:HSP90 family molecular chaperone
MKIVKFVKLTNQYKLIFDNKDELKKYTKVLLDSAKLIEGLPIENPTELSNLICEFLVK